MINMYYIIILFVTNMIKNFRKLYFSILPVNNVRRRRKNSVGSRLKLDVFEEIESYLGIR